MSIRRIVTQITQFSEKQGFPLIATLCVVVITASALWTRQTNAPYVSPEPPLQQDISASQLLQESLSNASRPTPAPTPETSPWIAPLKEVKILRPFMTETMQQSSVTGIWQVHAGIDLAAPIGTPVYAMSQGTILANGSDDLWGVWYRIDHRGLEAFYAGMAAAGDFMAGDMVEAGDTLGFTGNHYLDECDLAPHLHLEVSKKNVFADPAELWSSNET